MSQPLNKVGRELILDLINRTNNFRRPLTFNDIQLSLPTPIEVPLSVQLTQSAITNFNQGLRNTELTVYPAPESNFIRSKVVSYWRLDIAQLLHDELSIIGITEETVITNTNDVIEILNARYNLLLTEEDVVYEEFTLSAIPATYTLTMAENSYGYVGSVELTFSYDLAQIIFVNVLDGLHYPADPVIDNIAPHFVTEQGFLLAGSGTHGDRMVTATNGEAEGFIGIHRTGAGNPYVDPVGTVYTLPLADNRHWSFTFGVGLIETPRGEILTDLYAIELTVRHALGHSVTAVLERLGDSLVWSIPGVGPAIVDNAPVGSLRVAQNSQRTFWYAPFFPDVPTNSVGAHLGTFTVELKLTPIRAVYVKEINLSVTANIIAA